MRTSIFLLQVLRALVIGVALGLAVQALLTLALGAQRPLRGASGAERIQPPPALGLRS